MIKKPGHQARGTQTGRPLMVLLDVLGQRWTLRILWELNRGVATFRNLRGNCDDVSPTLLNARLKELRELELVVLGSDGFQLSDLGRELVREFAKLDDWANKWAQVLDG